jgi:hypothetical protein
MQKTFEIQVSARPVVPARKVKVQPVHKQDKAHVVGTLQPEFSFAAEFAVFRSVVRSLMVFTRSGKVNEDVSYGQWLEFFSPLSKGGAL